jgi:hypothetical protein
MDIPAVAQKWIGLQGKHAYQLVSIVQNWPG